MAPCDAQAIILQLEARVQQLEAELAQVDFAVELLVTARKVNLETVLKAKEIAGMVSPIDPRPDLYVPQRGQPDQGQFAAACGGGNAALGEGGKFGGGNEHG